MSKTAIVKPTGVRVLLSLVVVCLWLLTSCSGSSNVKSLLLNPGFESGTLSPWRGFQAVQLNISSSHAHTGKFSLAESGAAGSAYQDVNGLTPGTQYEISAWVATEAGGTATAQIAAYDASANIATFSAAVLPQEKWQAIKHRVTLRSSGTLRIHLFRNNGSGSVFWDDVAIKPVEE